MRVPLVAFVVLRIVLCRLRQSIYILRCFRVIRLVDLGSRDGVVLLCRLFRQGDQEGGVC